MMNRYRFSCALALQILTFAVIAQPRGDVSAELTHWKSLFQNMSVILLDDSTAPGDAEAVAESVIDLGGSVPVVFEGEAIVVSLPAGIADNALKVLPHVTYVGRTATSLDAAQGRHQAEAAIKYCNAARSGSLFAALDAATRQPPLPTLPDAFSPPASFGTAFEGATSTTAAVDTLLQRHFHASPLWLGRNASMNGRIYSTLFFVQCSGAAECLPQFTWNQTTIDDVTNRIVTGYQFWSDLGQHYGKGVLFTVRAYTPIYNTFVNVPVEPVLYPAALWTATEYNDARWVDPIMGAIGYASGDEWSRVRAYTAAVLSGNGGVYSAAFCSFIANNAGVLSTSPYAAYGGANGNGSYAYLGNFEILLSDPFGNRPYLTDVAPHETGHVFWACDEAGACQCTVCDNAAPDNRPPGNNASNSNCEHCTPSPAFCIMAHPDQAFIGRQICIYSTQHVGWPEYPCFDSVASGHWSVTYFNDLYDTGTGTYPHFVNAASGRDEGSGFIDHDWGLSSPGTSTCPVATDHFSAYYRRYVTFTEGTHTFTATADDGIQIVVDSTTVINALVDEPPTLYTGTVALTAGTHLVKVYYYEATGGATLHVSWN